MGPVEVKNYLIEQLGLMTPGGRLMLIASTENYIPEENLMVMIDIMEKATLPLTEKAVMALRA
jgi:hypothetical protein